jgi:hypothetical protein
MAEAVTWMCFLRWNIKTKYYCVISALRYVSDQFNVSFDRNS